MSRKSSFHEIQLKFRSLERKQREKKEIERKLEKCLKGWLPDGDSQILRLYVFGPSGFWTMAPLRYTGKI